MSSPDPGITLAAVIPPAKAFLMDGDRGLNESITLTSGCMAEDRSPPSPPPIWECVSTSPGRIILPVTSLITAFLGILVRESPTAVMTPS